MSNYLSDVIIYESFKLGKFNLITAPCGAGKSTAAFNTIPEYLNIPPNKSLILISTTAGAEQFIKDGRARYYDYMGSEWEYEFNHQSEEITKPIAMTYALFGAQLKKGNIHLEDFDYIVCDEIHDLNKYIAISRSHLKKNYPQALPWEINDMLQVTCFTYIALEGIVHAIRDERAWVFGLTATPNQLYKNDLNKLGVLVNEVEYSQKIHAYEIFQKFEYGEIEPILRALVPENKKRLFFFNTIKELKKYKQILIECGRAAEALWSLNTEPMDLHQLTTRDYVISEYRFPDDVQDLLINSAYESSLNIKDDAVQEIYIHTSNEDEQEQIRGRMRQDIERVGVYNKDLKKNSRRTAKLQLSDYISRIPACYFNVNLYTEQKALLLQEIGFPKKWPSLKKVLEEQGFTVLDKSDGRARYSIIVGA